MLQRTLVHKQVEHHRLQPNEPIMTFEVGSDAAVGLIWCRVHVPMQGWLSGQKRRI